MSNYPQDFSVDAFNRTLGSRLSPADQVYEAHAAVLNDVANRAYDEFPLNDFSHARERWILISGAMERASKALSHFVSLSVADERLLLRERGNVMDYDADGLRDAVMQAVGTWLFIYSAAIDRAEAA